MEKFHATFVQVQNREACLDDACSGARLFQNPNGREGLRAPESGREVASASFC